MSRGGIKVTKSNESIDWLDNLANKIVQVADHPATAVEAARQRNSNSILDQISAIISKQPLRGTVESVVKDYQDKTGLSAYLNKVRASEDNVKKVAEVEDDEPEFFKRLSPQNKEDIKNFIRNKCETHHGNIQVPALVEEVAQTFRQRGVGPADVNDTKFEKFVSDEILKVKSRVPDVDDHHVNLGRGVGLDTSTDPSNTDIFEGLNPAKF